MKDESRNLIIFNRSYSVRTDRSQEDINRAVEIVESRYNLLPTDPPVPEEKRLVLLALDLGLLIIDERRSKEELIREIKALTSKVEEHL